MKTDKQDRRVRKTRTLLRNALVDILQNRRLNNITVKELCDKADINRSTFYLHYRDIFDLWAQIEKEILDNMSGLLRSFSSQEIVLDPYPLLFGISNILKKDLDFYQSFFRCKESTILLEHLKDDYINYFISENQSLVKRFKERNFELYITFVISGSFSLFRKIVIEEDNFSLDKLASLIELLILKGLDDFIKIKIV